jgi:hypothetical protein
VVVRVRRRGRGGRRREREEVGKERAERYRKEQLLFYCLIRLNIPLVFIVPSGLVSQATI